MPAPAADSPPARRPPHSTRPRRSRVRVRLRPSSPGRSSRPNTADPSRPLPDQPKAPLPAPQRPPAEAYAGGRPGLELITRRPPKQKFANFEDYLAAHGGHDRAPAP